MVAFLRALFLGLVVNLAVSFTIEAAGYDGGILNVQTFHLQETAIHWSWPLFMLGTLLSFGILTLMES